MQIQNKANVIYSQINPDGSITQIQEESNMVKTNLSNNIPVFVNNSFIQPSFPQIYRRKNNNLFFITAYIFLKHYLYYFYNNN